MTTTRSTLAEAKKLVNAIRRSHARQVSIDSSVTDEQVARVQRRDIESMLGALGWPLDEYNAATGSHL